MSHAFRIPSRVPSLLPPPRRRETRIPRPLPSVTNDTAPVQTESCAAVVGRGAADSSAPAAPMHERAAARAPRRHRRVLRKHRAAARPAARGKAGDRRRGRDRLVLVRGARVRAPRRHAAQRGEATVPSGRDPRRPRPGLSLLRRGDLRALPRASRPRSRPISTRRTATSPAPSACTAISIAACARAQGPTSATRPGSR